MIWNENRENAYCEITPAIMALKEQWEKENFIDPRLYREYNVKRGLRDEDGRGVLTGLTRVAEIQSYTVTADEHILPADGVLYYRGIDCRELVRGSEARGRFAFEEAAYLLLFGELPSPGRMVLFILLLGIFAIGAPGVPGGTVMASLGLITGILFTDPATSGDATALMLAIFALQDSFGTACNVTGDGALTLILTGYAEKHGIKEA